MGKLGGGVGLGWRARAREIEGLDLLDLRDEREGESQMREDIKSDEVCCFEVLVLEQSVVFFSILLPVFDSTRTRCNSLSSSPFSRRWPSRLLPSS